MFCPQKATALYPGSLVSIVMCTCDTCYTSDTSDTSDTCDTFDTCDSDTCVHCVHVYPGSSVSIVTPPMCPELRGRDPAQW